MMKVEAGEQPKNKARILEVEADEQPINEVYIMKYMMKVKADKQLQNEAAMMKMEAGGGRLVEGFRHFRPSRQQVARAPVRELGKQSRSSSHLIG